MSLDRSFPNESDENRIGVMTPARDRVEPNVLHRV